jgi:hypothetical protein
MPLLVVILPPDAALMNSAVVSPVGLVGLLSLEHRGIRIIINRRQQMTILCFIVPSADSIFLIKSRRPSFKDNLISSTILKLKRSFIF